MKLPEKCKVENLHYKGHDPCVYWGSRGFGVRVYSSGKKTFVLTYRASSRKRLLTLGDHPAVSLAKAQDMAASYRLQIEEGCDPVAERRLQSITGQPTPQVQVTANKSVSALCDAYLKLHAVKKRSGKGDEQMICRFIRPAWGKLKAVAVTRAQVNMLHAQISVKTPEQANRVLALVKTMWNKARIWGVVPDNHGNPGLGVQMNKETSRERFVSEQELPALVSAIEQEPDIRVRAALWLFLLTGARKSELLEARWEHVDFERRELRIPRPKQGKPHVYPLSARAMEVMYQLPRYSENPYVIPGDRKGRHLVNISKPWNRVRSRCGLEDVTLHDLRRSVGSWLANSGHSLLQIGKVLGHSSPKTTQIYARIGDHVARAALESHAERMLEVLRSAGDLPIRTTESSVNAAK
jgi:integrase